MPLNFQGYPGAKTKKQQQDEDFAAVEGAAMSLAQQWRAHKLQKRQQEIEDAKLQIEQERLGIDRYKAHNQPSYVAPGIDPVTGKPTFTPYPQGTRPGPASPAPTPILDAEGRQVGTTAGKPTVLPKPNTVEAKASGESAEAKSIADNAISELNRIRPLNEKSRGGIFGRIAQRAESAVDRDKPSEAFTNTADVINSLKGMVVSVLKSTFGGQLSDGEREYLNEVYGAVEGMSRAERKIAIDGVERTLRNAQKRAASKASAVGGDPASSQDPTSNNGPSVPIIGDTFQGGKVLKVRRIE